MPAWTSGGGSELSDVAIAGDSQPLSADVRRTGPWPLGDPSWWNYTVSLPPDRRNSEIQIKSSQGKSYRQVWGLLPSSFVLVNFADISHPASFQCLACGVPSRSFLPPLMAKKSASSSRLSSFRLVSRTTILSVTNVSLGLSSQSSSTFRLHPSFIDPVS